jgi:Zn-dependent M28 family amino/carboxypeptidase
MIPSQGPAAVLRAGLLAGALALGRWGWSPGQAGPAWQAVAAADTAALMATVRALAADSMEGRRVGTAGAARARHYLVNRLRRLGLQPLGTGYQQAFTLADTGRMGVNLLGIIPGNRWPERYLVLSAHYDHLGTVDGRIYNGADDNASGVAAVLALTEAILQAPLAHSVIVALLDGEEEGSLGAKAFVAAAPVPRTALLLDVNLDMVSHSEKGELFAAGTFYSPALRPVLDSLSRRAPVRLRLGHDRPDGSAGRDWTDESDQGPFHAAGIPFIYFGVEDHKDYHRPSDDPETITVAFFGRAVGTIQAAVRSLDFALP